MAKKPTQRNRVPSVGKRLVRYWWDRIKRNPLKAGGSLAGFLVGVGAAWAASDNIAGAFISAYEHLLWATPAYARQLSHHEAEAESQKVQATIEAKLKKYETAQAEIERSTYHIRRELADGKRETAEDNLFKAQRDLKAANHALETETDPKNKQFIESTVDDLTKQVNRLEATKSKIEKGIEALEREKPKGD